MLEFLMTLYISSIFTTTSNESWIAPDWTEPPQFQAGSLFWMTNEYKKCPILYRTELEISDKPIQCAGFRIEFKKYLYVYLNGELIARHKNEGSSSVDVNIKHSVKQGRNSLVISTTEDGFSLKGIIKYSDGTKYFSSNPENWKVEKFPPLTMIEYEPCMNPDFDDSNWYRTKQIGQGLKNFSETELEASLNELSDKYMAKLAEDAKWRLKMLADKGIAIVDWEAYGWAGAERLPKWTIDKAKQALDGNLSNENLALIAESLARYIKLEDDLTNINNHITGLNVLKASDAEIGLFKETMSILRDKAESMKAAIQADDHKRAISLAIDAQGQLAKIRSKRIINDLCTCLDNKFGWFDTGVLLQNDISKWGLRIESPHNILSSPLSPASLITTLDSELSIKGWNDLAPIKVYNKPVNTGPNSLWAVLDGKVTSLKPSENGIVYDRSVNGNMTENWMLLVNDLSSGGDLPVELVFINAPEKVVFISGEKGTDQVKITFKNRENKLFMLRPLKEWRGLLYQAQILNSVPLNEREAKRYIDQCRLWSRALMKYPITFSEVFSRDPQNHNTIRCVNIYNYQEYKDEWKTEPITLAPLPPLATYGLMKNYPNLKVTSDAKNLGSRGIWGNEIAVVGKNYIEFLVPIDPIKRFGGFTSFCFGGTDIGEPGSLTEIETIKRTGSNSFRPQHNQTGERAMRTLNWCWERGLQNMFNTDEKWVPDIVEHFRTLAKQCKDYPPDVVAYDLLNEPETREPEPYNALMRKITSAIREEDKTHLIYIEIFPPWGPGAEPFPEAAFKNLEPTGDELTCYSFHDYEYRLPERWPNEKHDIRNLLERWIPAFKFSIDSQRPIHLGEFGGFEQTDQDVFENKCGITMMMDHFKIFDQFGWHWHYYSNRGTVRVLEDGSLQDSYVQKATAKYFKKGTFNVNH